MAKKSYNRLALQGFDIDDMEFVKEFKLDPQLAYTKEINTAMLERVYNSNVEGFMQNGDNEKVAKTKAGRLRAQAKAEIESLL